MVSRVAQSSWERNGALEDMSCDLGALLSSQGNREKEAWANLHKILPEIISHLSVALNPNTTSDNVLQELKPLSQIKLGHLEAEELFRKIIVEFEKRIRAENPDASDAIALLKNLILLVADKLDMLPIRDSKYETMIKAGNTFCQDHVDHMIKASKELSDPSATYAVISIVGAQSSGKSYLLNQLFGTDFPVMGSMTGWSRTTQGIMISRCIKPSLLILDVEGFDGVERQKFQDASFENRAALFTLAISDLMMVNINETDINREDGGGAKLFRAIFQERVELPQGSTLIIVVVRRYGEEVPLDILERQVKKRMEELWETVNNERKNVEFRDYIKVKVIALPDKRSDRFQEKVKELRKLLSHSTSELSAKVPASSFSHSSKLLWEEIMKNRRLDIPSHKVIVATIFCNKIADEACHSLYSYKEYDVLKSQESPQGFKETSDTLLDSIIAMYDKETKMYDDAVREKERKRLSHKIKMTLAVYARKIIIKMQENISKKFQHDFALTNLDSMEENVQPPYFDSWVQQYVEEFTNLCEDLKEFDTEFFHHKLTDLQSELHKYIRFILLSLMCTKFPFQRVFICSNRTPDKRVTSVLLRR